MFDRRCADPERMDRSDFDMESARRSFRFIRFVNRCFGGTRIVREFLAERALRKAGQPLRVLDVGSGNCDIPLAVSRWARAHGQDIRFTCVEVSPHAAALARPALTDEADRITLIETDIFGFSTSEPFDVAVGSMFFHHFDDESILRLIRHLRSLVRDSVMINDLLRSPVAYAACAALLAVASPVVRFDALLSIRKGFLPGELSHLLGHLEEASVSCQRRALFRIQATVDFGR